MLKNYFVVAYRNLVKNRVFSLINITGLAVGITCCVLLTLFISDELSYEKHFGDHDRIYRIVSSFMNDGGAAETFPRSSPPVAMTMVREFPELETATRLVSPPEVDQHLIRYNDQTFYEKRGYLVDSTFFDVFSYEFQEGDVHTALHSPSSVVLSHNTSRKIFGDKPALDELVIINSGGSTDTFRITGVLKPYIHPSQIDADFYMCMNSRGWGQYVNGVTTWAGQNFVYSFIKLKPQTDVNHLLTKLPALLDKYGAKDMEELGIKKSMSLQPLDRMHLYSAKEFQSSSFGYMDLGTSGNITTLYIMGSICLFILLIACINFMNLTTAKAAQRAGEVGIRKSMGAARGHLIRQFLGESMTLVVVAMVISLGLVQAALPIFNLFTQKQLAITGSNLLFVAVALVAISLITGLIAGSYPAFFLSGFQPAAVLKNKRLGGTHSGLLRQSLVVFQFVITITLVSSIVVIYKQMHFIQNKELGFNPEMKVSIPLRTDEARRSYLLLKDRLRQLSGVQNVTASTSLPGSVTFRDLPLYPDGSSMDKATLHFNVEVDESYFDILDIKRLSGRDLVYETDTFSFNNDRNRILVNQASLAANGMTAEDALGNHLNIDWQGRHMTFEIVGVVSDFHQLSMHRRVSPMIFLIPADRDGFVELCAALEGASYQSTIDLMAQAWKDVIPNTPFEYNLLSDNVQRQYEADRRSLSIITAVTILAIVISCLGLYGLSIFVAERKVKEIGIRKVLGATPTTIVGMLSKDFIKLVLIAAFISIPPGYYAMTKWLEGFAYQTDLSPWVFALASLLSFAVAWITISFESLRAAVKNPVDALRIE